MSPSSAAVLAGVLGGSDGLIGTAFSLFLGDTALPSRGNETTICSRGDEMAHPTREDSIDSVARRTDLWGRMRHPPRLLFSQDEMDDTIWEDLMVSLEKLLVLRGYIGSTFSWQ